MRLIQALALSAAVALLVSGVGFGGYVLSKRISSTTCYGCLGLNPRFTPFEGFWTYYPESYSNSGEVVHHPDWVNETLNEGKVIFIFVWATWCSSCKEQWDDMVDAGIVKGEESSAEAGEEYKNNLEIFSLDYDNNPKINEIIQTYHPNPSSPAIPLTVVITRVSGSNTIEWYAFEGYSVSTSTVENIIESAILVAE